MTNKKDTKIVKKVEEKFVKNNLPLNKKDIKNIKEKTKKIDTITKSEKSEKSKKLLKPNSITDDTEENIYVKQLKSFGLTENASKIYVYLLERGKEVGGSKIAVGTKLHRQYVYNSLPNLIEAGLIQEIKIGKQNKYKAVSPNQIEKIAKKKVLEAESITESLKKISKVDYEQDSEVLVGEKAIQDYEHNYVFSKKEKTTQYIIGGNTQGFIDLMQDKLNDYLVNESRKNITTYYIGNTKEKGLWKESILKNNDLHTKFIDSLPQGVAHMVVREKEVAFFSFLNPPLLYIVKSEKFAENYREFFLMLWNMCDKT